MNKLSINDKSRWLVPLLICIFCSLTYWQTTLFETVPEILKRGTQPSDFPQMVLFLIAGLAMLILFKDSPKPIAKLEPKVLKTMGLLVGFTLLAEIDMFLGLGVFAASLSFLWGEKRVIALFLVGVLAPVIVFFFFDFIFEIRFPRGILTNIWYG